MARRSWGIALAAVLMVGLLIGWVVRSRRDGGEPLARPGLEEARARWDSAGVTDYDFELVLSGSLEDTRLVEVRGGEVVGMRAGGAPVPEAAWIYWSIEGLFDSLATELSNLSQPKRSFGVDDPAQVHLRVEFDPVRGYPTYFLRHVMGTQQSVEWRVVHFDEK